jgi:hypothetical protein
MRCGLRFGDASRPMLNRQRANRFAQPVCGSDQKPAVTNDR